MSTVRVRFAPSPTGFLHVGGARTALFNWLLARHHKGTFILRIEDTDVDRSTEASAEQILESLQWLGLNWDEGPYYQSQRLDIYQQHLEKLATTGAIYPAFESKEELDAEREKAMAEKRNPVYDRKSLRYTPQERQAMMNDGKPFVWRFRVPDEGHVEVKETLMGGETTRFAYAEMGDFIITRPGTIQQPGMPLYNFVCAVDDALMGITHVIRGVEHLPNAAKQVLILQALGFPVPTFTHLPLIMKNNKKMSKRDGDADPRYPVSVSARRDCGYLREATINFLALLGWSFPEDKELFSVDELIEAFTLDRLGKTNANFDEDKYLHTNGWYIRNLPREQLVARVKPFLAAAGLPIQGHDDAWIAALIGLVAERCSLLTEFAPALHYFFEAPTAYEAKGVKKVFDKDPDVAERLSDAAELITNLEPFAKEPFEEAMRVYSESKGLKLGAIAQPMRLATTGRSASPGLFDVIELLGREETVRRLRAAESAVRAGNVPVTEETP